MSKVITIPTCRDPFKITINHVNYEYPAGATVEVPDEVAAQIEHHKRNVARTKPKGGLFLQDECIKTWEELVEEGHVLVEGTSLIRTIASGSKSNLLSLTKENQSCSFVIPEGIKRLENSCCVGFMQFACGVYMPSSIQYIGDEAFYMGGMEITHVLLYAGTIKQWNKIDISGDPYLKTVCCKDGVICNEWHSIR